MVLYTAQNEGFDLYMTGVLDKEQTLTTFKIRKLFNQLVFATEKGFPYFKLQKTVMWMLIKRLPVFIVPDFIRNSQTKSPSYSTIL